MSKLLLLPVCFIMTVCSSGAVAAEAVSFDCAKASGEIEELICSNPRLAELDRKLAETYESALNAVEGSANEEDAINLLKGMQGAWISGRNDCWKSKDKEFCASEYYNVRIAELEARYFLIEGEGPFEFICDTVPEQKIVAIFFSGERPSVRLEKSGSLEVGVLMPSASGTRYDAGFGISFWNKGDEALVEWPQGNSFRCRVKK